jgi:hypothetical protein
VEDRRADGGERPGEVAGFSLIAIAAVAAAILNRAPSADTGRDAAL